MTGNKLVTYLKKSFFTGAFKTVIVTLSTIIFLPLIIQQVGMETYGLISLTLIFGGMVVFADFGIAKSVTLLIGQNEDKNNVNTIVSNALMINLSMLTLIGFVFFMLVYFNVPILGEKLQITHSLKNFILFVGFILLAIMLINNLLVAILEAYYLVHYANIGFSLSSILINVFIYSTSILTDSIYILLMAPVVSFVSVSLYFLYIIKTHTKVGFTKPDRKQIKNMLSISYKFLNIGLINSLMIPANKYLLIYVTGSSATLGIFDIGLKIAMIANSFLNTIAQPLFGVFSNMNKNKKEILKIASKASILLLLLYIIGSSVFYFSGKYITHFIDMEHHEELFLIGMILLVGITFSSVSEPFYRALLGTERLNEALYLKLLIPVFNIIFYFILGYENSLEQIAFAYSLGVFLSSFIIIIYYIKSYRKAITK